MAGSSSVPLVRYDLAYFGVISSVINATSFTVAGLAGQGDGTFQGYGIYVLRKANGTTTAPHREQRACTAYSSAAGLFTHAAFTASLAVGDSVLLLHPNVAVTVSIGSTPGTTTQNWQAGEQNITTIGTAGVIQQLQSLLLDINALAGNITVRLYTNINGVERQAYSQVFSVAVDGPALWIVNGTLTINGTVRVTAQSNNAADNGQAIGWEYLLGGL